MCGTTESVLVGARGFEPPTSCSQSRRATGLRYAPSYLGYKISGEKSMYASSVGILRETDYFASAEANTQFSQKEGMKVVLN